MEHEMDGCSSPPRVRFATLGSDVQRLRRNETGIDRYPCPERDDRERIGFIPISGSYFWPFPKVLQTPSVFTPERASFIDISSVYPKLFSKKKRMSSRFFLEKELGLRMIRQCDSIGSPPRRDWGCAFAITVKDSRLDVGVSSQTRSRSVPVGCFGLGRPVSPRGSSKCDQRISISSRTFFRWHRTGGLGLVPMGSHGPTCRDFTRFHLDFELTQTEHEQTPRVVVQQPAG